MDLTQPGMSDADLRIAAFAAECYADPFRWVMGAFPWGQAGTALERYPGPRRWQCQVLADLGQAVLRRGFDGLTPVEPIRVAVSSGHGVGKGALGGMIINWLMSTRRDAKGTVSANTATQLEDKTWSQILWWHRLSISAAWFGSNTQMIWRLGERASWRVTAQTADPSNADSFQGQHSERSTSFYWNDEASGLSPQIAEVQEGGLVKGEAMQFLLANPTRNSGPFFEAVFGAQRDQYLTYVIDARDVEGANLEHYAHLEQQWGEDSDFFRVRVRGVPPKSSDLQFIDSDRVRAAQQREAIADDDEPLIAGVDCAGGGKAWNVVRFRRGLDGRSRPPIRVRGDNTEAVRKMFLAQLAEVLRERRPGRRVAAMFIDMAYGSWYVAKLHGLGYTNVFEVAFGQGENPDEAHCGNMRAYMYRECKDWLALGAIPEDGSGEGQDRDRLGDQLQTPGSHLGRNDRLFIESKEDMADRGIGPLDDVDAFVLTFAAKVSAVSTGQAAATRAARAAHTKPGDTRSKNWRR